MRWLKRHWKDFSDRLLVVPVAFVVGAVALSQVTLAIDRQLGEDTLPFILETTVSSADSILSTIAGGLISAITLLLSLVLVTVQLASSQFSPRTLRDWIGDRTQQRTIGIVLGTTVYCLLVLRETQTVSEDVELAPHISVLVAVVLAVVSLVAVVWSVDHLSNSMRIGSVARNLASDTVAAIEQSDELHPAASPRSVPATEIPDDDLASLSADAAPLSTPDSGWVREIDLNALLDALPERASVRLTASPGSFVLPLEPLGWVRPPVSAEDAQNIAAAAFDLGDVRQLEGDVSYGLLQMSDIALRALSPGINDPNTASDVAVHISVVLVALWERPVAPNRFEKDGKTVVTTPVSHAEYLEAGFSQILRYASDDHDVIATMIRSLHSLRVEVLRRELPGPLEPIDAFFDLIADTVSASALSDVDRRELTELVEAAAADPATAGGELPRRAP